MAERGEKEGRNLETETETERGYGEAETYQDFGGKGRRRAPCGEGIKGDLCSRMLSLPESGAVRWALKDLAIEAHSSFEPGCVIRTLAYARVRR